MSGEVRKARTLLHSSSALIAKKRTETIAENNFFKNSFFFLKIFEIKNIY